MSRPHSELTLILAATLLTACQLSAEEPVSADAEVADSNQVSFEDATVDGEPVPIEPSPTRPNDDQGGALGWSDAPLLADPAVLRRTDAAIVIVPAVAGARDYRVFSIPKGVAVSTDAQGRETVRGTTMFCAGYRQFNSVAPAAPELLRRIEVAGLRGDTRLVVEAIDRACPFPGAHGASHVDIVADNVSIEPTARGTFSIFTEAEIVARYGSMVVNGHARGPRLGAPAAPDAPKVLARTTIRVAPSTEPPLAGFVEDFATAEQPTFVGKLDGFGRAQNRQLFETSRFTFTTHGAHTTQFMVDRGRLSVVLADWEQEVMSAAVAWPKRPVALSDTSYLRVTFRVASNATQHRYWWLVLCGAATKGATIDASGRLLGNIVQTPFFYDPDGLNPSVDGWNCLQVFPRDGWPFPLRPSGLPPQSDIRVMVNRAGVLGRGGVVNVSPPMYSATIGPPGWFRMRDAQGALVAPILDDHMLVAPTTRFDLYVRRDRVVLFVEGEPRLCNDFPTVPLTMAEGALGFGQVLLHSAAERLAFGSSYWNRTGQRYYLENTPFVDVRSWDDLGFAEGVPLPTDFDEGRCHVHR